jgi:hypothetical protein
VAGMPQFGDVGRTAGEDSVKHWSEGIASLDSARARHQRADLESDGYLQKELTFDRILSH